MKNSSAFKFMCTLKGAIIENRYLISVILLGSILRLIYLGSNPPSVFTDELLPWVGTYDSMMGYGPFFVHQTTIQLIQEFVMGEIPSFFILGPSTLSGRLPGAIYGILLIFISYLLVKELFGRNVALLSAFLLAINPLAIMSSRVFYLDQASVTLFFVVAGSLFFLWGIQKSRMGVMGGLYVAISCVFFSLGIFGYFTNRSTVSAIVAFLMLWILALNILPNRIPRIRLNLIFFILPALIFFFFGYAVTHYFYNGPNPLGTATYFNWSSFNLLNQGLPGFKIFIFQYASYFNPIFLFILGGSNPSTGTQLSGVMLYPSILFFWIGICYMLYQIFRRKSVFANIFFLVWILATPVTLAALSLATAPQNENVIFFSPAVEVAASLGIIRSVKFLGGKMRRGEIKEPDSEGIITVKVRRKERKIMIVVMTIFLSSLLVFGYGYFVIHPVQVINDADSQWGEMYGFPQIAEFITQNKLYDRPIYLAPTGLGLYDDPANFQYYFYNLRTPLNFLNFYSGDRIDNLTLVNPGNYAFENGSLIITGNATLTIRQLNEDGYSAEILFFALRPNGQPAVVLMEVGGMLKYKIAEMKRGLIYEGGKVNVQEIKEAPSPADIGNSFSISVNFTVFNTPLNTEQINSIIFRSRVVH